jgi:AraC-like DNA-binding protein
VNRFKGKCVLVIDGDNGIGLATAQAFAAEGARLIITGRNIASLEQAKTLLGENTLALRHDFGDLTKSASLAAALSKEGVKLDTVFVNASIVTFAPFANVDEAKWNQIFEVNVRGAYSQVQALLPLLNRNASIAISGVISARIGAQDPANSSSVDGAAAIFSKNLRATLPSRGGLTVRAQRRVLLHIKANLDGSIMIEDLADIAGLSVHHFARAFKQTVGMSPHRYIVQQRVEKAAQLLGTTNRPLSEIALEVGFADQSHLSRNFNRFTGSTPNAFRRAQR